MTSTLDAKLLMFLKTSPQLSRKYRALRVCSHIHKMIEYVSVVITIALMSLRVTNIQTVGYSASVL